MVCKEFIASILILRNPEGQGEVCKTDFRTQNSSELIVKHIKLVT